MPTTYILISGHQGAGKTTLSRTLVREFQHVNRTIQPLKLADPLYEMHDAVRNVLRRYGCDPFPGIDGRLLQLLGTEWGRASRGENVWVDILKRRLALASEKPEFVVIDDVRFPNELAAFDGEKVLKVRLTAPEHIRKARAEKWREIPHASELALDGLPASSHDIILDTSEVPSWVAATIVGAHLGVTLGRYV